MLKIIKLFQNQTTVDPSYGDSNEFLKSVLVEVTTENYRQLMHEAIAHDYKNLDGVLDPPLRANEKIISGLFANALSKTTARSRPEARVDRNKRKKTGRVDFLAWYAQRIFAVELKSGYMNCENPRPTAQLKRRWNKGASQASEVQTFLRTQKDKTRYPNPVSLSLMVVIGKRSINEDKAKIIDEILSDSENKFIDALNMLDPIPIFQALYTFPQEFRCLVPRKHGKPNEKKGSMIYIPFVAFLARSFVKRG